jgi:two-component system phosphate regulon response regulator PhoB
MSTKILVVDDERAALDILNHRLREAGFTPVLADEGNRALTLAREQQPALIVLDLMLPGIDGFEVCRLLRRDPVTAQIPVIFLTARADEMDRIVGFELGAEDYVTKPFSPRELVLRIKRTLARMKQESGTSSLISCGALAIDLPRHEVRLQGERLALTATEFKLLEVLVQRTGFLHTRAQLLKDVWNYDSGFDSRTVDTHIRRLREKMGSAACHIETVRGAGYRFVREPEQSTSTAAK